MQKEDLEQFSVADVTITIVQRQSVADEIELVDPYLDSTIIDEPASIFFHLKASMTLNGSYVFLICGFMRVSKVHTMSCQNWQTGLFFSIIIT